MFDILKNSRSSSEDRPSAAKALPDAIITQAFGKDLLARLGDTGASSGLALILKVPSESWCDSLKKYLDRHFPHVETQCFGRTHRSGSAKADPEALLVMLGNGSSTIAISATPEDSIDLPYHAIVDTVIEIDSLDAKVVRRVIRQVTGERPKGLAQSHLVGISLHEAMAAIGSGGTAGECVARIQRIHERKSAPADLSHIPSLDRLPLVGAIREWTDIVISDLARVDAGAIGASGIRFATLEGPPGTGKSLLAAAVAKSSGWRLHKTTVQEWFNAGDGHLGAVTKACASFIDSLLAEDRSIGFIDELQSIPDRAKLDARGRDWWMPVVDGILVQIDRVRQSGKKVMLLGACNHYHMLDAALVRADLKRVSPCCHLRPSRRPLPFSPSMQKTGLLPTISRLWRISRSAPLPPPSRPQCARLRLSPAGQNVSWNPETLAVSSRPTLVLTPTASWDSPCMKRGMRSSPTGWASRSVR